jgi:hypothetical protein
MSGDSFDDYCPNCGGSMECYADHKRPHHNSAQCLNCGWGYSCVEHTLTPAEIEQYKKDMGYDTETEEDNQEA